MKEAAGEANMTVITIVLIAVVLAVGTVIVNRLMHSTQNKSCCTEAGGYWSGGTCQNLGTAGTATYNECLQGVNKKAKVNGNDVG